MGAVLSEDRITAAELAELKRIRIGKPKSYAAPNNHYQNPERYTKLQKERIEIEKKRAVKKRVQAGKIR